MRIGSLVFEAPICFAELRAIAPWWTPDHCPRACTPRPLQPHFGDSCVCVPVCVTAAVFDASALDSASFSCETDPSFLQLPIRIGPLSFVAPTCVAEDKPTAS